MILSARLRKKIAKPFRQLWPTPSVRVQGVPEGVSYATLVELCLQQTGSALKNVAYTHLSGWKKAGAYRLYLQNAKGREWSLIYKNAIYSAEQIPALVDFPITPGYPEFLVYSHTQGPLKEYLPDVYSCKECIPGIHYQYFLEDLGSDFESVGERKSKKVKLNTVAALPAFHDAMTRWTKQTNVAHLIHYDQYFLLALLDHAQTVFDAYARQTSSSVVHEVCRMWPKIAAHFSQECMASDRNSAIHGDANCANILVHKKHPDKLKMIDWEWAGIGMAFADVVSLYSRGNDEKNARVLSVYCANAGHTLPIDHATRVFNYCRFERGLLDAVYVASQHMGAPEQAQQNRSWAPMFVDKALDTIVCQYRAFA